MNMVEKRIEAKSKADVFYVYPIGDPHIGAFNCAESHLRAFVDYIKNQPHSYWFGGGDYCNAITPSDVNRYDVRALADWIFTGKAMNIKEALLDIAKQERERFCKIVEPIKDKCLGLIEGNHEYQLMNRSHNGHHYIMCDELGVPNLTDCAFIRLNFKIPKGSGRSVIFFVLHGWGGGRTPGAEPNHLMRAGQIADADVILRGHSHTFRIEPSEPHLYIPSSGSLPDECYQREVFKGNWGCWVKSFAKGPSTYDSRANYPARPLKAIEVKIKPNHCFNVRVLGKKVVQTKPLIMMRECSYEF